MFNNNIERFNKPTRIRSEGQRTRLEHRLRKKERDVQRGRDSKAQKYLSGHHLEMEHGY